LLFIQLESTLGNFYILFHFENSTSTSIAMTSTGEVKRLELRPDRALLDSNFESYKLALEAPPVQLVKLAANEPESAPSDRPSGQLWTAVATEDQYAYSHAKVFYEVNLLVLDSWWDMKFTFLLDLSPHCGLRVWKVLLQGQEGHAGGDTGKPQFYLSYQTNSPAVEGRYNASLVFAGRGHAVLSDGAGQLTVLETGDRDSLGGQWQVAYKEHICGQNKPFAVRSALLLDNTLHVLVHYVEATSEMEGLNKTKVPENFVNVLEWLEMSKNDEKNAWSLDRLRRFAVPGTVDYAQMDKQGLGFYLSTEKPFFKVYDSSKPIEPEPEPQPADEESAPAKPAPPPFFWHQNVEDVLIWAVLPEGCSKRDIKVVLKPREISLEIRGERVFSGQLWNVLDTDSMTWTIQGRKVEITACKANEGLIWQRFLTDVEKDGEELEQAAHIDQAVDAILSGGDGGPAKEEATLEEGRESMYNAQELEECDALPDNDPALYAYDGQQDRVTARAGAGSHQALFNARVVPAPGPDAMCLRHDVDGLLWQPERDADGSTRLVHVGTFPALGYVQASKKQRKLTICSPSMSYACIVEGARRAYVYRQPSAISEGCDLRNRKTGRKISAVAKQQVVTLEDTSEPVVGVAATDEHLLIATSDTFFAFSMTS